MRFQKTSIGALVAAAAAAGYLITGTPMRGPGDVGVHDAVDVELVHVPLPGGSDVPTPEVSPTTPLQPLASCEREILINAKASLDLFGSPEKGYWFPPGTIDPRVVDGVALLHKAGTQQLYANVQVALYDGEDGHLKDLRELGNLVVNGGRDLGIRMLVGDNTGTCPTVVCGLSGTCALPAKFNYVGIGSSATVEAGSQTALVSEFTIGANYTRQQDTAPDFPGTAGQAKLIVTFGADNPNGGGTITESAVFNASSAGTMLARRTFGSLSKADQDVLQITWTFTLS